MASSSQFELGKVYDFNTHVPDILGNYRNAVVIAQVDYRGAQNYGLDVNAVHNQVFSRLPEGSAENDPTKYFYLAVRLENGTTRCLGLPWIDGDSVALRVNNKAVVTITGVSPDDLQGIRRALTSNGFNVNDIRISNS